MRLGIAAAIVVALGGPAAAQHQHGHHGTPYAGQQTRGVKALSDQQIADLRAGRGMGLALAGELNGYPGPLHVLELGDQLALSTDQRTRVQALFDAMKAEAIIVGEALIRQETELDRAFAAQAMSQEKLDAMTGQIGQTQGRLRAVHLKYHLTTASLLTPHQRHQYASLRGYR